MSSVNTKDDIATDSNDSVENWYRIVKYGILNSESRFKAADCIRSIYAKMDDRIATFKFAFTRLASKVFKPNKRKFLMEDEKNCKEEWSKMKRIK